MTDTSRLMFWQISPTVSETNCFISDK